MNPSPVFWVAAFGMLSAAGLYWLALRETACLAFPSGWKKGMAKHREFIKKHGMSRTSWQDNRLARVFTYEKICAKRNRSPRYYRRAYGFFFAGEVIPVSGLDEKTLRQMAKKAGKSFK